MFRPPFRIRNLILYLLIYLLGFVSCIFYLQIAYITSGAGRQIVIESDLVGGSESSQQFQLQQSEPCTAAAAAINNVYYTSASSNGGGGIKNVPGNTFNNNLYYEEVTTNDLNGGGGGSSGRRNIIPTSTINDKLGLAQDLFTSSKTSAASSSRSRPRSEKSTDNAQVTTVYVVTPTFYRPEQKPELTRIAQALLPANQFIHWIVVDDISQGSDGSLHDLQNFLQRFPLTITLLKSIPRLQNIKVVGKPRGVNGRRAAIEWLRKNAAAGVVYFADDDNTYDSDIFRQMQSTKKISMWPVGLVTELGVSSPIVRNGKIIGFFDGWNGRRKFPVDMAGFAINVELFHKHEDANMPWVAGYEEDQLLQSLEIKVRDIVPLANNCTEILVWHTKALRNGWPKHPRTLKKQTLSTTNLQQLLKNLPQKNLAGPNSSTKAQNDETIATAKRKKDTWDDLDLNDKSSNYPQEIKI